MRNKIKILKALANNKRMEIIDTLFKNKDLNVVEIADEIKLHFKSTSKHLQKLVEAGLVARVQNGFRAEHNLEDKIEKLLRAVDQL